MSFGMGSLPLFFFLNSTFVVFERWALFLIYDSFDVQNVVFLVCRAHSHPSMNSYSMLADVQFPCIFKSIQIRTLARYVCQTLLLLFNSCEVYSLSISCRVLRITVLNGVWILWSMDGVQAVLVKMFPMHRRIYTIYEYIYGAWTREPQHRSCPLKCLSAIYSNTWNESHIILCVACVCVCVSASKLPRCECTIYASIFFNQWRTRNMHVCHISFFEIVCVMRCAYAI